jgi:hypothetical protein
MYDSLTLYWVSADEQISVRIGQWDNETRSREELERAAWVSLLDKCESSDEWKTLRTGELKWRREELNSR